MRSPALWTCRLRLFFQRMVFIKTISARATSYSTSKLFTSDSEIEKGIWYIMPVYNGDHMSLQGDFSIKNDITDFYIRHMIKINNL